MPRDAFDLPLSTNAEAARAFDAAAELVRLYHGDPIAALDAALERDPGFTLAWAARAAVLAQQTDRRLLAEARRSVEEGRKTAGRASQRERDHLAAADAWTQGRFFDATAMWGRIAQDHPRDLLALQFAHLGDFLLGQQFELRDRPLQALRAWGADDRARHAVLGMAAFGLEECGDYGRAEEMGREAAALEPRDGWAVHAVTHVCEMQGRAGEGASWLRKTAPQWAPESGFAFHIWWHIALFELEGGDVAAALATYDEKIRPTGSDVIMEMLDASALLWRVWIAGGDVGARFGELADVWVGVSDQRLYPFNDVHAVMALIGDGRNDDARRVVDGLAASAAAADDNGAMAREVGLPLARGLLDFAEGRHADAADALHALRARAQRFGGSHAQRDLISLTLLEAAMRAGRTAQAEAIAHERRMHKPDSAAAKSLLARARRAA